VTLQRAKSNHADLVMLAGGSRLRRRRFTRVDRDAALPELHDPLQHALSDDEVERRALSKALLLHVQRFYAGYFDPETHLPYYRPSSRT
jgi:5-methylthioadenosine/S-adenosylhomocysteine deaminase